MSGAADELWLRVAALIRSERGWSLRPVRRLGRPRADRCTWLAEGERGGMVVKLRASRFAAERAAWAGEALPLLCARGYPVPELLWSGQLDEHWFAVVQTRLPGEPPSSLDRSMLEQLLALAELQAEPHLPPSGWDVSWWIGAVLFEGCEDWWDGALASAPKTARRLEAFLGPSARGHLLPAADIVHGDLILGNVLARDGVVTGIVDWDDVGCGTRAFDLTSLLFDWQRRRLAEAAVTAPDGGDRLAARIVEIAGEQGLRCLVTYGAIARLALSARRGERDRLETWQRAIDAILDS